jgi:hypothetical protein
MSKLKSFGLALAAILAIGSTTASAAQAQLTFTGSIGGFHLPTFFRGFQSGGFEFRSTAGTQGVSCTGVSFTGQSETGKSKTITASAGTNQKCSLWPGYTAHRSMNTCDYKYNITKKINEHKYEGTTDIQCTTKGDVIDYQVTEAFPNEKKTLCTIKVEEQSGVGPIYYENITPMMGLKYVVIKANATNLKTITEANSGKGSDCNVPALGTHTTGTLTGETELDGLYEEIEIEVTVSG